MVLSKKRLRLLQANFMFNLKKKKFNKFSVRYLKEFYKNYKLNSVKLTPLILKYLRPVVKSDNDSRWVSNHFYGPIGNLFSFKEELDREKLDKEIELKLVVLNKFRGSLIKNGKIEKAHTIFLNVLVQLSKDLNKSGSLVLVQALSKIKPYVRLEVRRIGGAKYSVPRPLSEHSRYSIAIKWLIKKALSLKGVPLSQALKMEVLKIHRGDSDLIKVCSDLHNTAINNRMFVMKGKKNKFKVIRHSISKTTKLKVPVKSGIRAF